MPSTMPHHSDFSARAPARDCRDVAGRRERLRLPEVRPTGQDLGDRRPRTPSGFEAEAADFWWAAHLLWPSSAGSTGRIWGRMRSRSGNQACDLSRCAPTWDD
jgi:hypothetical protein